VYSSLARQTFKDFEWLIIDDGSDDNTREIIGNWQKASSFEIRYVYQPNKGQMAAFNNGVGNARGELFLPADSDDEFLPDALEVLNEVWQAISQDQSFSGVTGLCIDSVTRQIVGDTYPTDVFDSNYLESRYRYNVSGEKWGFQRTSVLGRFPFPEGNDQRHIYPGIVWMKIAREYRTRYINVPLRVYYQHEDGTQTKDKHKHPDQLMEWHLLDINRNLDYLRYNSSRMVESFVNLGKMQILSRYPFPKLFNRLNGVNRKLLLLILYPLSKYRACKELRLHK
jgi:glycosyltransferase involved in cell wall biosynthesis